MTTREVASASAATFASACLHQESWEIVSSSSASSTTNEQNQDQQPCTILDPDTIVRVNPMNREYGGWNDAHFHPQLRLPFECHTGDGIVVTLEAMARECVAIALSPDSSFQLGKTYVVHFGAAGNVSTVIRRRLPTGTEAVDVTMASRVCSERSWISYYVVLQPNGKLYVGTGKVVGDSCIGFLDDSLYHQLRPGSDAVKFVGLGNSALGRNARPLKIRNVCVTTLPAHVSNRLQALPADLPLVTVDKEEDQETRALMEEYQKECQKNRARAQKFGIPYKEPSQQAFFQWSKARRLRANPDKGFITGMDITAPEELAKQEARKARFGIVDDKKRKGASQTDGDEEQSDQQSDAAVMMEEDVEPLPILQAWDNKKIVGPRRTDPPASLFANPPSEAEKREETEDFAMQESAIKEAALVPEKINLFAIDWAAFKQIRTDDIMAYFASYGPSYVEWLGELSCNVLFEDKFSAARALQHMSQELPSPPPPEVQFMMDPGENPPAEAEDASAPPDLSNMGWHFCHQPIRKIKNDRHGRRGTMARVLMRVANTYDVLTERPKSRARPPPGFTTKRVLGPGSDFVRQPRQKKRRRVEREEVFDPNSGEEHPALSRGLTSGRGGFSVEELQRERALKANREQAVDDVSPTHEQG